MKTESKEKIEKATRLAEVIELRKQLEKEESDMKAYFKAEITDGILEAGNIIILIETKQRTSLDQSALEAKFGHSAIHQFEKITMYQQVNVKVKK